MSRHTAVFLGAAMLWAASALSAEPRPILEPAPVIPLPRGVEVAFTADGIDLSLRVAEFINLAKREVLVSHYAITDPRVMQALVSALQRGCIVAVVLDRAPAIRGYDTPRFLRSFGIPVIGARRGLDGENGWHNNRYVLIDRELTVLTSCDLTTGARRNTENLIALHAPAVTVRYYNTWLAEAAAGEPLR